MKNEMKKNEEHEKIKKKNIYYCDICNKELDNSVVFWCRKNKEKFKGKLLCREHQS